MNAPTIVLSLLVLTAPGLAQQTKEDGTMKDCPMHEQHSGHHAVVESHGDQAMGFPHDATTHHFRLMSNGGVIEVRANNPDDKTNIQAIRLHLKHIATMFANADFSTPMFIHDGVPPGTTTMKLMKAAIHYTYEEMPSGGRVRIQTDDPIALAAIHDFLRFQITDHQTGDSLEESKN
jgi:TusA-related sulfurtransferase